jgi:hypothetical protein
MATITTKSGDKFEGILSGSPQTADFGTTLKMTKKQYSSHAAQANGIGTGEAALVGTSPEHMMSFNSKEISEISISELLPAEPAKLLNGRIMTFLEPSSLTNIAQVQVPSFRQIPTYHEIRVVASASFNDGFLKRVTTLIFRWNLEVLPPGISLRQTRECSVQPALSTRTTTQPPSIEVIRHSSGNKLRRTGSHARLNVLPQLIHTCARNVVKPSRMMAKTRRTNIPECVEVSETSHP